jgi:hypothetical protein
MTMQEEEENLLRWFRAFKPGTPAYYDWLPSSVPCSMVSQCFPSFLGQAIQYIWRAGRKYEGGSSYQGDLQKAIDFLTMEIKADQMRYSEET